MKNEELVFDRTCHVLYSKTCEKEIKEKIALHYPEEKREEVWTDIQKKYVDYLKDWRTDLGGKKNFHNGKGGTYDCIALMCYYVVCKNETSLRGNGRKFVFTCISQDEIRELQQTDFQKVNV